jgi:hypothetical protein
MRFPLFVVAAATCALAADAYAQKPVRNQKPTQQKPAPAVKGGAQSAIPTPEKNSGSNAPHLVGPNDACGSATVISGNGPFAFDTVGATTDGPPACGNFQSDVWYNWTSGVAGTYIVDLCSGGAGSDTEVAVYDTAACVGPQLACNDDFCGLISKTTFVAAASSVYKIRVGGYNANQTTGTFTVTLQAPPPPPSPDDCTAAQAISGSGPFGFNNLSATTGSQGQSEPACNFYATTGIDNDVWFTWTAGSSGAATLTLCGQTLNGMDSKVAVYRGAGCPSSQALACNDDDCALESSVRFCVTNGQAYTIQLGNYPGAAPDTGTFTITVLPLGSGNDECTAPVVLGPTGPYNFDNTAATTSCAGQSNSACNFYATTGIDNDLWFTWTAGSSGQATLTMCGTANMDSKVAIYTGAGCPTGQAIACNDDACGLESTVCFAVTNGTAYTIQLGNYPSATGNVGTFDITIGGTGSPCTIDDGSSENALGWIAGGDMVWLQAFGSNGGGSTLVSNVQVVYGSAAGPGSSPPNGSPARVALWDDPNDDGDPSDAVLLQVVNTTVANVDLDVFNTVPIPATSVNGVFFVGVSEVHLANQFVAPMDQSSCIHSGAAWFFGNNNATPADLANIGNNAQLPISFDNAGFPCNLLVRAGCNVSPLASFCLPGQDGVHICPCSNPPAGNGLGCNNFGAGPADSGTLSASGDPIVAADTLVFTASGENNTSFTIIAQGTTQLPAGVVFGAGVRCVAGTLKRLYTGPAGSAANGDPAGTIHRPGPVDTTPVHTASANKGFVIIPPITLYYFAYYRDPSAAVPCGVPSSTFNSTQAGAVLWQ